MKKSICLLAIILIGSSLNAMEPDTDSSLNTDSPLIRTSDQNNLTQQPEIASKDSSQESTRKQDRENRYSGVYTTLINNLRENPVPRHGWRDVVWPQRNKIHAYNDSLKDHNPGAQLLNHPPSESENKKFLEYHNPPQKMSKSDYLEDKRQLSQYGDQAYIEGESQTMKQKLLEETNTAKNTISNQGRLYKIQSSVYSVLGLAGLGYFFYKTKDSSLPQLTFQAVLSSLKDNLKNNTSAFIYGGLGFFGLCNAVRSYKTAQEYNKAKRTHDNIAESLKKSKQ